MASLFQLSVYLVLFYLTLTLAFDPPTPQIPLIHRPHDHKHNVSLHLFNSLEELSRLIDISYCVGTTSPGIHPPFLCASRCDDFPEFSLVTTWNTGPLLSDSCGYLALSHPLPLASPAAPSPFPPQGRGRILVAFRGTYSLPNFIADLSSVPQEYLPYPASDPDHPQPPACPNCTVHSGFLASWRHTRPSLLPHLHRLRATHPSYTLQLVGHSLGGAVAALAALDLEARGLRVGSVTTFGEPRVGNSALADYIDAIFASDQARGHDNLAGRYRRVTHIGDTVPLLPPRAGGDRWSYASHASEIFIGRQSLPAAREKMRVCEGRDDPACIAGEGSGAGILPWLPGALFAHRDYFHRLGLCVPGGDPGGEWQWD